MDPAPDDGSDSPPDPPSGGASPPKRRITCAKCRNHGKIEDAKGHKRHCPFGRCGCDKCMLIEERRKVMAEKLAERWREEEEEMGLPPAFEDLSLSGTSAYY